MSRRSPVTRPWTALTIGTGDRFFGLQRRATPRRHGDIFDRRRPVRAPESVRRGAPRIASHGGDARNSSHFGARVARSDERQLRAPVEATHQRTRPGRGIARVTRRSGATGASAGRPGATTWRRRSACAAAPRGKPGPTAAPRGLPGRRLPAGALRPRALQPPLPAVPPRQLAVAPGRGAEEEPSADRARFGPRRAGSRRDNGQDGAAHQVQGGGGRLRGSLIPARARRQAPLLFGRALASGA